MGTASQIGGRLETLIEGADRMLDFSKLLPMLLDERPLNLDEPGWLYEIKFDGYRCLAEVDGDQVRLRGKTGSNMTAWFPEVCKGLADLKGGPHILDGEVCVLDELGRSDFDRFHARAVRRRWYPGADPVVFCAFDLLATKGQSIIDQPVEKRKQQLARLLKQSRLSVLLVGHFTEGGRDLFARGVLLHELEGLVAKRLGSPYVPAVRSRDWVKVKRKGAVPAERFKREPKK